MNKTARWLGIAVALTGSVAFAETHEHSVEDSVIEEQNAALLASTEGKGFGPQSPRDIDAKDGQNLRAFGAAPEVSEMTLCDIHLHENAEHKGGEFTTYAGNGDGEGAGTGFKYNGELTEAELAPVGATIGAGEHGDLVPGDTVEIHFVHSTAQATLGNGLGTCLNESIGNPQLRVEAVVAVLVNDPAAADFTEMAMIENIGGLNQVPNLPNDLGTPVVYDGSTTGPKYNETGSPFQVTWSVRPNVIKIDINSLGVWLESNAFGEEHAHGVRNLVTDAKLLSVIE